MKSLGTLPLRMAIGRAFADFLAEVTGCFSNPVIKTINVPDKMVYIPKWHTD